MENAMMIAKVLGPVYVILGLSILMYQETWQKLIKSWGKDHFGVFGMMMMSLVFGLIMIGKYNVWEWNVWLIVTVSGWLIFIKGAAYFLLPGETLKAMMNWAKEYRSLIFIDGLILLAAGTALCYYSYMV